MSLCVGQFGHAEVQVRRVGGNGAQAEGTVNVEAGVAAEEEVGVAVKERGVARLQFRLELQELVPCRVAAVAGIPEYLGAIVTVGLLAELA